MSPSASRVPRVIAGGDGSMSSCFGALNVRGGGDGLVSTVVSRRIGTISKAEIHLHLLSSVRVKNAAIGGNACVCTRVDSFNGREIGNGIRDVFFRRRVLEIGLSLCSASKLRNLCIPRDDFERAAGSVTSSTARNDGLVRSSAKNANVGD